MRGAPPRVSREMDALVSRARRLGALRALSDPLLLALLSHSDPLPDRVQASVVLFNQGDCTSFWYLLLSGQVDLYIPSRRRKPLFLRTLGAGSLFGELEVNSHCCSAVVTKAAEFVKIQQSHFLSIYKKHADHIQPFIIVMQDILPDERDLSPQYAHPQIAGPSQLGQMGQPTQMGPMGQNGQHSQMAQTSQIGQAERFLPQNGQPERSMGQNGHVPPILYQQPSDSFDLGHLKSELPPTLEIRDNYEQGNIFEFSSISLDARMSEVAWILRQTMKLKASHLIRERIVHNTPYSDCMVGSEMVDWLQELALSLGAHSPPLSRFQITGIWQTLLEHNAICHVTNEQQFADKHLLYRWMVEPSRQNGHSYYNSPGQTQQVPSKDDITSALFFLSTVGPDALFRMILKKSTFDRTPEELELVYEELLHVKALSHLSTMVKRELATVIGFEHHTHAGTVLFHQGDAGKNWYIVLKGSVDVSIHGKGVVCTLQEGDDFGKLALVNDAPRAATVALREDDSQFLVVDKYDFNRILRDVEANTVRLKEHGEDVLILEKMVVPRGAAVDCGTTAGSSKGQCCYSVMAGLPEKMIEYVLETRVDAQLDSGDMDVFLEDFILTHIIYMPSNVLCNYLKNYYKRSFRPPTDSGRTPVISGMEVDLEQCVAARRQVVIFVQLWVNTLGIHYFLDPAANAFLEELYCCVLEDSRRLPRMDAILNRMTSLRLLREEAMRTIARHPCVVLECGVLAVGSPAPQPILPNDSCNQILHLSDTTSFVMSIRMDKTAAEICEMARTRLRYTQTKEQLCLVEVKSGGERVIFSPLDVSIPTMLSLNSKLYVVYKDEINSLVPQPDQNGPVESVHSSVIEFVSSSELAQQLLVLHSQLFEACDEIELITQVVGREQFPGRVPSNLDLIIRRFNEVQYWTTTEIILAPNAKRLNILRKFIKIAMYAKENKDLMSFFAITLGLSNIAVSRLTQTWQRLPAKMRRQFAEFESLLDPSRNHRPYRALVAKMSPPYIPFVPLLLKDLTFVHDGNKTYYNGLVNFEKMHMIANVLRSFRECKSRYSNPNYENNLSDTQNLLRNFRVIDNQRRLMELSYQIEPRKKRPNFS